jgi:hypothetical protein
MGKVTTGKPDAASHVKGIAQGNSLGSYDSQKGHNADGTSTQARSTGINAKGREPIDPRMPNLSPA